MNKMDNDKIDPRLAELLDELKPVPARDVQFAARARAQFMAQVDSLSQAESHRANIRLIDWFFPAFRKKSFSMNALFSILLIVSILLGGAVTTVYAAQNDLPTELLYPIKLETENFKLWLNTDPQAKIDLLMEMSQTRINEMLLLNELNIAIPEITTQHLEQHIQDAFKIATSLNDKDMKHELIRIQSALQADEQLIIHAPVFNDTSQVMMPMQAMLQSRLRLVENGLTDPNGFRNSIYGGGQKQPQPTSTNSSTQPIPSSTPSAGNGNGYGPNPQPTSGGNNQTHGTGQTGTPTPGQGGGNGGSGHQPTPRNGNDDGGNGTGKPDGGNGRNKP